MHSYINFVKREHEWAYGAASEIKSNSNNLCAILLCKLSINFPGITTESWKWEKVI